VLYVVQPRSFTEIAASYTGAVLDSAQIAADGSFSVIHKDNYPAETALLMLCVQKKGSHFANQFLDEVPPLANYMPVVWSPNTALRLKAEAGRFQATCTLLNHADADNRALQHLRDMRHQSWQQQYGLQPPPPPDEHHLLEQEAAWHQFQQPLMQFADTSTRLWPALVATRWVSTVGDYERIPEFLVHQCQKWNQKAPDNPYIAQMCQKSEAEKLPVLTGDNIPDAAFPMASGDTVQWHTLLGKRLTVLDIWASWCAPCRRENKDVLLPLWTKYRDSGLQIIAYSIDSSPVAWKNAIAKDRADWPHASHLSGDDAPFLQTLRISTIPANFILDSQGKILAKNLHGEALKAFIEDFLKR
jgi:thiol-disulfide isomerase/thioredoxin